MLILNQLEPIHWALAGAAIAAITLTMMIVANQALGISTGFAELCSLGSRRPYFRRDALRKGMAWRLPFWGGLLIAGVISAATSGGWKPLWDLGMWDQVVAAGTGVKVVWMFVGGVFIGLGTRIAGGCTSGHGIFGMSSFQWASLRAVLAFMAGGIITTNLVYRVIFGG